MLKLYLNKLWDTGLFAVGFLFTFVCYGLFFRLFVLSRLPLQKIVPKEVLIISLAIISLLVVLAYIYRQRRNNKRARRAYIKQITFPPCPFFKDFWQILQAKETLAHTLAFLSLDFIASIFIGISAFSTLWSFFLGMFLLLITQGAVFILINTFLWCQAHRRWIHYWQNHAV